MKAFCQFPKIFFKIKNFYYLALKYRKQTVYPYPNGGHRKNRTYHPLRVEQVFYQ